MRLSGVWLTCVLMPSFFCDLGAGNDCGLMLSPPEVFVGPGDSVKVNCTSRWKPLFLSWDSPISPQSPEPGVQFIVWSVPNLTKVEDLYLLCVANFTDAALECKQKLKIHIKSSSTTTSPGHNNRSPERGKITATPDRGPGKTSGIVVGFVLAALLLGY